jgi:hypothetical protein
MADFFQNIWADLREKRLWPVAVVLLIGIVAVPVVLAKSSEAPTPSAPPAAVEVDSAQASLALDTGSAAASGTGSSLDVFAPDDPFAPPRIAVRASESVTADVPAGGGETADIEIGGGGGETIDVEEPAPPRSETETETTSYEYVADVSLWQGERRRRIKGLRKLDMLPNQSAPLLIFMGATTAGGNATFLVDSTLTTAGEGSCRPSASNCAFVDIGPGSEHVFTTEEGETLRLRIEEIRRVEVKSSAAAAGRPTARTSVGTAPATRRFSLPALVDLVEVSSTTTTTTTTTTADSSNPGSGR